MSALARDLVTLLVLASAPAGVALYVLRKPLTRPGRFWMAQMMGLSALSVLGAAAVWWATAQAERDIMACLRLPAEQRLDCEDAGLLVGLAGVLAVAAIVLFLVGGIVMRLASRGRR
jgi:hypothetical protein